MTNPVEHVRGQTTHVRRGALRHSFQYGVDFVLIEPEVEQQSPRLFSRNAANLAAVHDVDHGGGWKSGHGTPWARAVLADNGLEEKGVRLFLLTQPRCLGYVFNPVSFWLAMRGDDLVAVIAEVSTPFKDRHSYLCHSPGFTPITPDTRITKPKALHVSPFQDVKGDYEFAFALHPTRLSIRIRHDNDGKGVWATLTGTRASLTNLGLIAAVLRRPAGAMRTISLIYWQALKLKLKGAPYRSRPAPPTHEVT